MTFSTSVPGNYVTIPADGSAVMTSDPGWEDPGVLEVAPHPVVIER